MDGEWASQACRRTFTEMDKDSWRTCKPCYLWKRRRRSPPVLLLLLSGTYWWYIDPLALFRNVKLIWALNRRRGYTVEGRIQAVDVGGIPIWAEANFFGLDNFQDSFSWIQNMVAESRPIWWLTSRPSVPPLVLFNLWQHSQCILLKAFFPLKDKSIWHTCDNV